MGTAAHYLLAAAMGAALAVLALGALIVGGLYYAHLIFDYDTKSGPVASGIVGASLAAPFLGAAVAIWRVHARRRVRK